MNTLKTILLSTLLGFAAFADEPVPETEPEPIPEIWTLKEIDIAQRASLDEFVEQEGDLKNVVGYSIRLTSQKNAARAVVYSKVDGELITDKYFCHVHKDRETETEEIDCH